MKQKSGKKKVMIVDDDKGFLEELAELLELSGYEIVVVNNALSALDTAAAINPDVILMDIKMPGKSGFQVIEELRRFPNFENIPVVAMSGFYQNGYEILLNMYGVRKCLRKPFQPLDVIAEIEKVVK